MHVLGASLTAATGGTAVCRLCPPAAHPSIQCCVVLCCLAAPLTAVSGLLAMPPSCRFCLASYLTLPFRPAPLEGSLIPTLEVRG